MDLLPASVNRVVAFLRDRIRRRPYYYAGGTTLLLAILLRARRRRRPAGRRSSPKEVSFAEFLRDVEAGNVVQVLMGAGLYRYAAQQQAAKGAGDAGK